MIHNTRFLIIGAGPTGLGAAYRLKDMGHADYLILDRNNWVGGLAASFQDPNGFTWDIGGHVQFSHYTYFDEAMDLALGKDGWLHHERESWVWMRDRFIPYPFQNNIRYLPKEDIWNCIRGAMEIPVADSAVKPANFKEWIFCTFGSGIAELFMLPYNFKVWAYAPDQMDYQWIGERVSIVDLKRIVENVILEKDDLSWGPNNLFRFPKFGGTGAIWRSIGKHIGDNNIRLDAEVVEIAPNERRVKLSSGEIISYEYLLSTMPLSHLVPMVRGIHADLITLAKSMKYSTSHIVGVGLTGQPKKELASKCWMYFPENNCPFYRVTLFSKYSPNNVPDIKQYFSLMTEVSESPEKPVNEKTLPEQVVQGLINTRLIESREQVCSLWHYPARHGYPTPFLGRDGLLRRLLGELESSGVYSRGRFGAWRYEVSNQDHSFMQGVEWVNRVINGETEKTLWGTH